jgi:alpha-L-rhamnosidase
LKLRPLRRDARPSSRTPLRLAASALLASVPLLVTISAHCAPVAAAKSSSALAAPVALACEHNASLLAVAAPSPRLSWLLAQTSAGRRGVRQSAYRILVSSSPAALLADRGDLWDTGKVPSAQTIEIPYRGLALHPRTPYYWKVRVWDAQDRPSPWSAPAAWRTAPAPSDWKARWIADTPDISAPASPSNASADVPSPGQAEGNLRPMPIFRHAFPVRGKVAEAILYASGLGQYEVHLNGAKVGHRLLTPGWTDYRKTVLYDAFDVTALLRPGQNALGVLLGNGMYNVGQTPGRYAKFVGSYGQPKCLVQLEIRFADGSSATVASDATWRTAPGPILFSSTYGGEDYDARRQPPGWDRPGFRDASWKPAVAVAGPGGALLPEITPPIRLMRTYAPVRTRVLARGRTVYDLGQNFAGWPALTVQGLPGASVKLIPGELLNPDGSVSQRSSGQPQWFRYTLAGHGREHWSPRFSYYGFRYVQVETSGPPSAPAVRPVVLSLAGDAVHSSAVPTGMVETSSPLLNQIHQLILRAIENNTESLLTDCPHREKLGWLEQTHLLGSALNFDFDLDTLYEQLSDTMADAQHANGMEPEIAPQYTVFEPLDAGFNDSPEWGSALVLDPWIIYRRYGDLENLRAHYSGMQRYVAYLGTRAENHIIRYGLGDWYDIGPGAPGFSKLTTLGFTATAIYYQDILVLQQTAGLFGDPAQAQTYAALAAAVRDAFNRQFYDSARHIYDRGSQTAQAMPLVLGLAPEPDRPPVLANLIADIHAHGDHVTAGDIGFHYVVDALTQAGRSDVILALLTRRDAPSYGYQLSRGATALTEAWDANPDSSQDHFMLGHAEDWYYRGLAGIRLDLDPRAPQPIRIEPAILPGVPWVRARYASALGLIRTATHQSGRRYSVDITLPPNTSAAVVLPAASAASITEGVAALAHAPGISAIRQQSGSVQFQIASGTYHFSAPLPTP